MTISKGLLDTFYEVVLYQESRDYRGYSIRFLKLKKEIRLEKDSRALVSWFIEQNQIVTHTQNHKNPAEKSFAKKFVKLPAAAEDKFQQEKESRSGDSNSNDECMVTTELRQHLNNLKTQDISYEKIDRIVSFVANKFVDDLYDIGNHPDKYADNFPMYYGLAKSSVWSKFASIKDDKIGKQLIKMINIIPVRAQREGNLVLVNELDHKRFSSLVEKARKYSEEYIHNLNPFCFFPSGRVYIFWWERSGLFFTEEDLKKEYEPESLREHLIQLLASKPRKQAKPSHLELRVEVSRRQEKEGIYRSPQPGIIEWIDN